MKELKKAINRSVKEYANKGLQTRVKLSLSEEAEWMQYFNEKKEKVRTIKSKIEKTDKQIDRLVYELYGLTENEIRIVDCILSECHIDSVVDLSKMYFWETNVHDIQLVEKERFTKVINKNSKVLYAIDSDVVWWKPLSWDHDEERIFRGSLGEFSDEVHNGFPTTDLYPEMKDFEIEEELLLVCQYLKSWAKQT